MNFLFLVVALFVVSPRFLHGKDENTLVKPVTAFLGGASSTGTVASSVDDDDSTTVVSVRVESSSRSASASATASGDGSSALLLLVVSSSSPTFCCCSSSSPSALLDDKLLRSTGSIVTSTLCINRASSLHAFPGRSSNSFAHSSICARNAVRLRCKWYCTRSGCAAYGPRRWMGSKIAKRIVRQRRPLL